MAHKLIEVEPVFVAGYLAAAQALAEHAVIVADPRVVIPMPTDVVAMLRQGPAAYTVYAFVLDYGIYLQRTGRFGLDEELLVIEYPVPHTDPGFAGHLAGVLVPVAERLLAAAADQSYVDRMLLGPDAPVQAWDALTEVAQ